MAWSGSSKAKWSSALAINMGVFVMCFYVFLFLLLCLCFFFEGGGAGVPRKTAVCGFGAFLRFGALLWGMVFVWKFFWGGVWVGWTFRYVFFFALVVQAGSVSRVGDRKFVGFWLGGVLRMFWVGIGRNLKAGGMIFLCSVVMLSIVTVDFGCTSKIERYEVINHSVERNIYRSIRPVVL